jgi:hypothetical protein
MLTLKRLLVFFMAMDSLPEAEILEVFGSEENFDKFYDKANRYIKKNLTEQLALDHFKNEVKELTFYLDLAED